MDEQNEQIEQDSMEQTKRQMQKVSKDAARAGKKIVGKAAKEGIKALVKAVGMKVIIIAICVIIIIIALAAFLFQIKHAFFDGSSEQLGLLTTTYEGNNTSGNNSNVGQGEAKGLVKIENRSIILDTETFNQNIENWLRSNAISGKALGLSDDYRELKAFLEAEAATLYPDLRERAVIEAGTPIEEGQLQGCVKFYRNYDNGERILLEYMPYDEYATELAKLGVKLDDEITQEQIYVSGTASKSAVEAQFNKLRDKFTLDKNQNIVIVGLKTDETIVTYSDYAEEEERLYRDGTEYSYYFNIEEVRVNYQSVIQKYAMQFELCVALLLTTDNPEYCMEVANLAKNSSIVIDIQDNVETNKYTTIYSHKSKFSLATTFSYMERWTETIYDEDPISGRQIPVRYEPRESGPHYASYYSEDSVDAKNYETIVETVVTPKPILNITYADTWIAHIECEYKNEPIDKVEESTTSTSESVKEEVEANSNQSSGGSQAWDNLQQKVDNPFNNPGIDGLGSTAKSIIDGAVISGLEDDGGMTSVPYYHPSLAYPKEELVKADHSNAEEITITDRETKEQRISKQIEYRSERYGNSYNLVKKEVKETPQKFLSLLRVDPNNINPETGESEFNLYNFVKNTEIKKYMDLYGSLESPSYNLLNNLDFFYELLSSNTKTQNIQETMQYLILLYQGKTTYDESRFSLYEPGDFNSINKYGAIGGSYYGNNVEEKLWWALKDAGYSDIAAAAALGNVMAESGFHSDRVQGDVPYSNKSVAYTEQVDSGSISEHDFVHNGPGGGGYGLAQWTSSGRKQGLYDYTKNDLHVSIANVEAQISYLMAEIQGSYAFHSSPQFSVTTREGQTWSKARWENAKTLEEATKAFCHAFERGRWGSSRLDNAQTYYDRFGNGKLQKPTFDGETIQVLQYSFPHYLQKNYAHVIYKSYDNGAYIRTVASSGCGPTSLSMVLSGLKNDPSINPETLVANLKEYYPDGSYHVRGVGSSNVIYATGFLQKYYGCKSTYVGGNQAAALQALDSGLPCIGHEDGHILAVIPVSQELKAQGYKFYILDSARGHSGAYKSIQDATNVVKGTFSITYVIQPV